MARVFLSHSSADKLSYVELVANKLIKELGEDCVIMDNITFQEGRKTIEEIEAYLDVTDLFVFFISATSLESSWVKKELFRAESLWKKEYLLQICPIIIENNIKYDDDRIPDWMKENYNLQYISSPNKSARIIRQRMIEISLDRHPRIKERQEIFVGRNELIQSFEERIDDFSKNTPRCIFASGIISVGRRTLIKKCIVKTNIRKSTYQFPFIPLNYDESIEDFILKLYDLGVSAKVDIKDIVNLKMEQKRQLVLDIIVDLQKQKEIILIEDKGCIVNHDGELADWFLNILSNEKLENKITFCLISKFKLIYFGDGVPYETREMFYNIEVTELSKKERNGLLKRYLEFEELNLETEDVRLISDLLFGYPEQIFYAVSLLKDKGLSYVKLHTEEIVEFNNRKASILLRDIEANIEKLEFISLLSSFDYVGLKFIIEIVENDNKYINYLNEFLLMALCEYVGSTKEYIRVNETVKDYIVRNKYKISNKHKTLLENNLNNFLLNLNLDDYDVPEFLYSLKEALVQNKKVDEKYLIPSIYLKTMNEFYNRQKNKEVVSFADKALENEMFMDSRMIFEIRYLLCSALAKLRNSRFLEEVQMIKGADHDFLFGFYYRQIGKYDKALEKINESMSRRYNFSKAKREKVQIYLSMQEFQAAKDLAKENYSNYKENPYHIQAYYACLIKAEKTKENKEVLLELLSALQNIKSKVANEMYWRCKAQYEAFYNEQEDIALADIEKAINLNSDIHYAYIVKFDICEKFNRIQDMKGILEIFRQKEMKNKYFNNIICFESILKAKEGKIKEAVLHYENNIRNYTDEAMQKFVDRLRKYESSIVE